MNIKRWLQHLLMKKLDLTQHCNGCMEEIQPFSKTSEQDIYIRRYVGGKGHLINAAYHKECLMDNLYIDFLFSGRFPL